MRQHLEVGPVLRDYLLTQYCLTIFTFGVSKIDHGACYTSVKILVSFRFQYNTQKASLLFSSTLFSFFGELKLNFRVPCSISGEAKTKLENGKPGWDRFSLSRARAKFRIGRKEELSSPSWNANLKISPHFSPKCKCVVHLFGFLSVRRHFPRFFLFKRLFKCSKNGLKRLFKTREKTREFQFAGIITFFAQLSCKYWHNFSAKKERIFCMTGNNPSASGSKTIKSFSPSEKATCLPRDFALRFTMNNARKAFASARAYIYTQILPSNHNGRLRRL